MKATNATKEKVQAKPTNSTIINNTEELQNFSNSLLTHLVNATKASRSLPSEDDFQFHSTNPEFNNRMKNLGERILDLTQKILVKGNPSSHLSFQQLELENDPNGSRFKDTVVDVVDELFEDVELYVDGVQAEPKPNEQTQQTQVFQIKKNDSAMALIGLKVPRPQDKWNDVDNSPTPFLPKITHKPNAQVPLDPVFSKREEILSTISGPKSLGMRMQGHVFDREESKKFPVFPHPYEHELINIKYLPEQLEIKPEQIYQPLDETPCHWISEPNQLKDLLVTLNSSKEIAIDLEHHAYRSYQGFTCLMQISTRKDDYLIDCLELRDHLYRLNEAFTNPKIVKVLHGADFDILWLQRDFGLYIVNMFDTGQATRLLDFPSYSLAYLLKHYCQVTAEKKYQLADWRIRPLPEEMKKYAREDTHYLLFIYDKIKNETITRGNEDKNLVKAVLSRSRDLCLKLYEKDSMTPQEHMELKDFTSKFNGAQTKVFQKLYEWRDTIAREHDESLRYVLPNHMLIQIAKDLPVDLNSLMHCCKPVPPLVRVFASDLVHMIARTVEQASLETYMPSLNNRVEDVGAFVPYSKQIPRHHYYQDAEAPLKVSGEAMYQSNSNILKPVPHSPGKKKETGSMFSSGIFQSSLTPSPVLTTEQLYKQAKWTEDPGLSTLIPSQKAVLAKQNEDFLADRPLPFSLLDLSDEDSENDSDDENSRKSANLIASTISKDFMNPIKVSFSGFGAEDTNDSLLSKMDVDKKPKKVDVGDDSSNIVSEVIILDAPPAGTDSHEDKKDETSGEEDANDGQVDIPQSMAEIYQLSNKTRKKKKKKKNIKKQAALPESPLYVKDGEGDNKVDIREKKLVDLADQSKEDLSSSVDFMRSIGWLGQNEEPPEPTVKTSQSPPLQTKQITESDTDKNKNQWKANRPNNRPPGNGGGQTQSNQTYQKTQTNNRNTTTNNSQNNNNPPPQTQSQTFTRGGNNTRGGRRGGRGKPGRGQQNFNSSKKFNKQ